MKLYELTTERANIIEGTTFEFPLIFVNDNGHSIIGKYEWRHGRSTDWIITTNGSAEYMWEYTKVGVFAPVQETLEQKIAYIAADHVLQHGGSVYIEIQKSDQKYDVTAKPVTTIGVC